MYTQKNVAKTLTASSCSVCVFAGVVGFSRALLSLWLRGVKTISPVAEARISEGLHLSGYRCQLNRSMQHHLIS